MTIKDVQKMMDLTYLNIRESKVNLKLDGMQRPLSEKEQVFIAYYDAVLSVLNSKGLINDLEKAKFQYLTEDSNPNEMDYE